MKRFPCRVGMVFGFCAGYELQISEFSNAKLTKQIKLFPFSHIEKFVSRQLGHGFSSLVGREEG